LAHPQESRGEVSSSEKEAIEILMIFTGFKRPIDTAETIFGLSSLEKEETFELELRLIHEILKKHRGTIKFEVSEKKPRTLISLRLPVERRRVVYYPVTPG